MNRSSLFLILLLCAPAIQAQGKFAGKWDTEYGPVFLTQNGNTVKGSYYDGRATLEGKVEKNRLTFTWTETGGNGDGEFDLSDDGKSFKGRWKSKGGNLWNDWNGKLVAPRVARKEGFAGRWKTNYGEVILTRDGNAIKGSYYDGTASLEGKIEQGKLIFKWVEQGGKGDGEFELSADGHTLMGRWRSENDTTWYGWNGEFIGEAPKK